MSDFDWIQTVPPLLGALVGAAAAIGTQLLQGGRQRSLARESRLEAAVEATLAAIDIVAKRSRTESDLLVLMHHRISVLRGWAMRCNLVGLGKILEEIRSTLHSTHTKDALEATAANLSIVCTMWLEDQRTFERHDSPTSVRQLRKV